MATVTRRVLLVLTVLFILVAAGTLIPRPFSSERISTGAAMDRILVLTNPIHTDIAVPMTPQMRERFAFLEDYGIPVRSPDAAWLVVGWGGRSFYIETPTWAELKPGPLLKALTVDSSVLHLEAVTPINETRPGIAAYELTEEELARLADFILASFSRDAGEEIVVDGASYRGSDRFFEAEGYFNALLGCNTWAAGALRAAGLRTGWWNPLPQTLGLSLKLHN